MQIAVPEEVSYIIKTLNEAGYEAYAVGGCVRDACRGAVPNDWDITTSALPEETKSCFAGQRIIETGIRHGTVAILLNHVTYEITTYRIDGDYRDGRHPEEVRFVKSIELDLARRDFTVNAMAFHPETGLIDPFGGRKDLEQKLLRCVGDPMERFSEDALRIMRALRFSSCLGFEIESRTGEAVHRLREQLNRIAAERITAELLQLLSGSRVKEVLTEYADVIFTIIPELAPTKGCLQNTPYHDKDVWDHTVEAVAQIENDPLLRLTMLLHDISKPECYFETYEFPYLDSDDVISIGHFKGHPAKGAVLSEKILRRLRCDARSIRQITALIRWHDERPAAEPIPVKKLMAKMGPETFLLLQKVRRADTMAQRRCYQEKTVRQIGEVEALARRLIAEDACISVAQLDITGKELIAAGLQQGKSIGQILEKLLDLVMEEKIPNEREALVRTALLLSGETE